MELFVLRSVLHKGTHSGCFNTYTLTQSLPPSKFYQHSPDKTVKYHYVGLQKPPHATSCGRCHSEWSLVLHLLQDVVQSITRNVKKWLSAEPE